MTANFDKVTELQKLKLNLDYVFDQQEFKRIV
jgi:hypothetical protein